MSFGLSMIWSLKLVEPSVEYKESFLDFVEDVKKTGYESYNLYTKSEEDFEEFIIDLKNSGLGINLPEGWAPCSSYWLVDAIREVVGVIRIRHRVDSEFLQKIGHIGYEIKSTRRKEGNGSKILELGLSEARKIGLKNALITCDEGNIGSKKIIEKFNGKYKGSFVDDESGKIFLQYEICVR